MSSRADRNRLAWKQAAASRNAAAAAQLRRSMPSVTVPIGDSRYTCPGYLFCGEYYYSFQDVAYPWDPGVLRAIREFEPTAMPVTIRSIWQRADYGNLQDPFVLVRHGIARIAEPSISPVQAFRCELPVHHDPELFRSRPHTHSKIAPNLVEVNHYSRDDRPYGHDLPGEYLPFSWPFYHMLYETYENHRRAKDISDEFLNSRADEAEAIEKFNADEGEYIDRDIQRWEDNHTLSDVEAKEAMLAVPEPDHTPMVTVPAHIGVPV